jgi:hypothetical protein
MQQANFRDAASAATISGCKRRSRVSGSRMDVISTSASVLAAQAYEGLQQRRRRLEREAHDTSS